MKRNAIPGHGLYEIRANSCKEPQVKSNFAQMYNKETKSV